MIIVAVWILWVLEDRSTNYKLLKMIGIFQKVLLLLFLLLLLDTKEVLGLSTATKTIRQVALPLLQTSDDFNLKSAFQTVVDSTEFLIQTSPWERDENICSIPELNAIVQLRRQSQEDFVLNVETCGLQDFGMIMLKFYEYKELLEQAGVDVSALHHCVKEHLDRQPPHPGYHSSTATLAGSRSLTDQLFHSSLEMALRQLQNDGYVILDTELKTTSEQTERLQQYFQLKNNQHQSDTVRTDKVQFLDGSQAQQCGLEHSFNALMGIASVLNKHLDFRPSPHTPLAPASRECPLTNPNTIQMAEYGKGDFYIAHSDNSLTDDFDSFQQRIRNNFRHYTCILYCNDNWTKHDGGALRLYPHTRHLLEEDDAVRHYNYIDVLPQNGKLLIFDSCLVHSVQPVTSETKTRRALTLWINRPDDSGVKQWHNVK